MTTVKFGDLNVDDAFTIEGSSKVYIKTNRKKRSGSRPFDCNAVAQECSRTVKRGWFEPDTVVVRSESRR